MKNPAHDGGVLGVGGIVQAKKNRLKCRLSVSRMQLPHDRAKYTPNPSSRAIPILPMLARCLFCSVIIPTAVPPMPGKLSKS